MKPFTLLQSLYWQKEELHDAAFKIEQHINSYIKRGLNAANLWDDHASVIGKIAAIEGKMAVLEGATA